eukprot:1195809-Prorocentrum_minimum.AAC.9
MKGLYYRAGLSTTESTLYHAIDSARAHLRHELASSFDWAEKLGREQDRGVSPVGDNVRSHWWGEANPRALGPTDFAYSSCGSRLALRLKTRTGRKPNHPPTHLPPTTPSP